MNEGVRPRDDSRDDAESIATRPPTHTPTANVATATTTPTTTPTGPSNPEKPMFAVNVRSSGSRSVPMKSSHGSMPKSATPPRTDTPIVPTGQRRLSAVEWPGMRAPEGDAASA